MEKLNFNELVYLVKGLYIDYDKLLPYGSSNPDEQDKVLCSEECWDKIFLLRKLLDNLSSYRPLPFD